MEQLICVLVLCFFYYFFYVIIWYCHDFFPCSPELVNLTTRFTDELMAQGLTKQILNLISDVSVTRVFERLQKERGLGNEKHRKEVKHPIQIDDNYICK